MPPNIYSVHLLATDLLAQFSGSTTYDPHDAQLEGICKAVDGINIMVLTPTGSGKTGYLTMHILLMISLAANPELVAPSMKKVCQNPVMVTQWRRWYIV
jgi:Lhr-like helicase